MLHDTTSRHPVHLCSLHLYWGAMPCLPLTHQATAQPFCVRCMGSWAFFFLFGHIRDGVRKRIPVGDKAEVKLTPLRCCMSAPDLHAQLDSPLLLGALPRCLLV